MKEVCISHGSVMTFFICGGHIYNDSCQMSSGFYAPKIIKAGSFLNELFEILKKCHHFDETRWTILTAMLTAQRAAVMVLCLPVRASQSAMAPAGLRVVMASFYCASMIASCVMAGKSAPGGYRLDGQATWPVGDRKSFRRQPRITRHASCSNPRRLHTVCALYPRQTGHLLGVDWRPSYRERKCAENCNK